MNCAEFREHWSAWHEAWPECDPEAMRAHWHTCAACAEHDRQMRRLTEALAGLPLQGATGRGAIGQGDVLRGRAPRWSALAATLVLGIAVGLLWAHRDDPAATIEATPVTLDSSGEQQISIAVDSSRSYDQVEFLVELPQGVELAGFPGQRSVRWEGQLAEGRSRLRLPLRLTAGTAGGELVARIRYPNGERRLIVPLEHEGLSTLSTRIPA